MMNAFIGMPAGVPRHRGMPRVVEGPTTAPPEVGPVKVSDPALTALVAREGVPIGYTPAVFFSGDPVTQFPNFCIDGLPVPEEVGPTFRPPRGSRTKHVSIRVIGRTGYGSDAIAESRSLEILPALATAAPSSPTAVNASTPVAQQVQLTWVKAETDADGELAADLTGYKIYHRLADGTGGTTVITGISAGATTHTITGLTTGVARLFSVAAINAVDEGNASAEVQATPT